MPARKATKTLTNKALLPVGKSKKELGLLDNKAIPIKSLIGIDIDRFRSIKKQQIKLGSSITVLSGRNGTMKTSLMGLIAHPFTSEATDAFGRKLKTSYREVFKLSPTHDIEDYDYNLILATSDDQFIREPVKLYWVGDQTNRHRVVVSGSEKGDGNLTYNTSFLNLKRLFPLVNANAKLDTTNKFSLSQKEAGELKDFYETIFPSTHYSAFTGVYRANYKTTFAPSGNEIKYDWNSISSGEDNLGAIFNRLIGFQRSFKNGQTVGNGILCIDEFESSLHPVAQLRLFDYLYKWSQKYKVQIIISTHSLGLISDIYLNHKENMLKGRVCINFISKSLSEQGNLPILYNPDFNLAYKELTLQDPKEIAQARKIKVFCEDEIAIYFTKKLITSQKILKTIEFHSSLDPQSSTAGISYTSVKPLATTCAQFPVLLEGCLVLLDADVPESFTNKIKNKDLFLILPDPGNLAIERRIIAWIVSLDNGNPFFTKFGEKERFLDSFKQSGLESLAFKDIVDENIVSISKCKAWVNSDLNKFKTYLTYYCKNFDMKVGFLEKFLLAINKIYSKMGLPEIQI